MENEKTSLYFELRSDKMKLFEDLFYFDFIYEI